MGLFDRLRGSRGPKVAFIGIDGVPYTLITDNPDVFPNLTSIAQDGSAGAINSIIPPESSACWPSLTTGVNPGHTGVYGFQDREIGTYDTYVPMGRDVQATRIWNRVHDSDREATVMNVPVTFPPQRNIQRMVSGFLSPGVDKAATPENVRQFLDSINYRVDVNAKLGHREDKSDFIEDANQTIEARSAAFNHYVELADWDLFFGVFMTTDRVNHFLFKNYEEESEYYEDFLSFYRTVDDYIGRLHQNLPDDTTLIVASDHGFTSLHYEFHANEWLRREGWLTFNSDEPEELNDLGTETRAYSLIPGRFYLNLEGREPRGSVGEDDYESTRSALRDKLTNLEGPNGQPVITQIIDKEDAFDGEHDDIAPDLVAIPNNGFDLKAGFKSKDEVYDVGPRNGMHTFDNAALFIDTPGARIENVDLLDIAPTILSLMDIDYASRELDGRSLV